jgi:ribulose 1,5-bisphosphate synthetase/thiazole synthase
MLKKDIVIIGGGMAGLTTAVYLTVPIIFISCNIFRFSFVYRSEP